MHETHVHFERDEFAGRQRRARAALAERGLDGLLLFKIEDMYWLCGLDTDGFALFHAMFLGTEGGLTHLARDSDLANVRYSSLCGDIRHCPDGDGVSRAAALRDLLASHRMRGRRVGIQLDTFGLTPALYQELRDRLAGWCELVDASRLIAGLRLVKSPRELGYVRRAGEILDGAREAVTEAVRPGVTEGELYGLAYRTVLDADGDPPAHRPPIGAGPAALNTRYTTGHRAVTADDQVTFELGAGYRHYHAVTLFMVLTGPRVDPRQLRMHEACVDALDRVQAAMRPGGTVGDLFEVHRSTLDRHGFGDSALSACGYSMGAVWPPTWMERPQLVEGEPTVLVPGMTLFTHMILVDREHGLMMGLGEQAIVGADGPPERVTHVPREPVVH